jgi:hypothetical protein
LKLSIQSLPRLTVGNRETSVGAAFSYEFIITQYRVTIYRLPASAIVDENDPIRIKLFVVPQQRKDASPASSRSIDAH